ncbi:MAG: PRC-barrel domain-containing protein [Glycocaulis sp.]|mgnify:CR=1 FL=1
MLTKSLLALSVAAMWMAPLAHAQTQALSCEEEIITIRTIMEGRENDTRMPHARSHVDVAEIYRVAGDEAECLNALHRAMAALEQADQTRAAGLSLTPTQQHALMNSWSVSTSWIGRGVYDRTTHRLGEVTDVVVSRALGHQAFAIVEFGGVLGIGSHKVAIPVSAFRHADNRLHLDTASQETLRELPRYDHSSQ